MAPLTRRGDTSLHHNLHTIASEDGERTLNWYVGKIDIDGISLQDRSRHRLAQMLRLELTRWPRQQPRHSSRVVSDAARRKRGRNRSSFDESGWQFCESHFWKVVHAVAEGNAVGLADGFEAQHERARRKRKIVRSDIIRGLSRDGNQPVTRITPLALQIRAEAGAPAKQVVDVAISDECATALHGVNQSSVRKHTDGAPDGVAIDAEPFGQDQLGGQPTQGKASDRDFTGQRIGNLAPPRQSLAGFEQAHGANGLYIGGRQRQYTIRFI